MPAHLNLVSRIRSVLLRFQRVLAARFALNRRQSALINNDCGYIVLVRYHSIITVDHTLLLDFGS
jgi:hypothetical protein